MILSAGLGSVGLCTLFSMHEFVSLSDHRLHAYVALVLLYGLAVMGQSFLVALVMMSRGHGTAAVQSAVLLLNVGCVGAM